MPRVILTLDPGIDTGVCVLHTESGRTWTWTFKARSDVYFGALQDMWETVDGLGPTQIIPSNAYLLAYEDTWRGPAGHDAQGELECKIGQIEALAQLHHLEVWRDWERVSAEGIPGRGIPVLARGWKEAYKLKGKSEKDVKEYVRRMHGRDMGTIHESCAYLMSMWVEKRVRSEMTLGKARAKGGSI